MSTINQEICSYLIRMRKQTLDKINSPHPEIVEIHNKLLTLDTKKMEQFFYKQLVDNSLNFWPRSESELNGLYFEILDFYYSAVMADVYGIISDTLKFQAESYPLGYEISFGKDFERLEGVEHDESPISPLYEYDNEDKEYLSDPACKDIEMGYCLSFYLALHHATRNFVKTEAFLSLPRKKPFHFLIAVHDDGPAYPIWIEE